MKTYRLFTSSEVANLLRELDPTLKTCLKALSAAKGESMTKYMNNLIEWHVRDVMESHNSLKSANLKENNHVQTET